MARVKYVSRTVATTKVEAICYNEKTQQNVTIYFTLPGDWSEETRAKIDREIRKRADENGDIAVKIKGEDALVTYTKYTNLTISEKLYEMEEQKFIRLADRVGDPRPKKD